MTSTLYLFTGNSHDSIPADFALAEVEALIDGQPHTALHVYTGQGTPDLARWQEWTGETATVDEVAAMHAASSD